MFAASLLLVIQFCLKNDTKYSNFLLSAYVDSVHRIHAQYIVQVQIRKAVVDFMYKYMPFNVNFTLFVPYIF